MGQNQDNARNTHNAHDIYALSQRFTLKMTLPMRLALEEVARKRQTSASDIVRQCVLEHADHVAPGFAEAFLRAQRKMLGGVDEEKAHKV